MPGHFRKCVKRSSVATGQSLSTYKFVMCSDMVKQASYVKFDKLLSAALVIVCTSQLTAGNKSSDVSGIMLPKVKQRVIEAGSDFNITCIYKKIPQSKDDRGGSQKIKWKLPDSVHNHKDVRWLTISTDFG